MLSIPMHWLSRPVATRRAAVVLRGWGYPAGASAAGAVAGAAVGSAAAYGPRCGYYP
jgi:hypothetical protein